jgi:DNA-binding transcriptional ArsR family regulator
MPTAQQSSAQQSSAQQSSAQQSSAQQSSDQLNMTFAALADPTRRAILAHLVQGEASVTELAQPFEMSLPAISKHLKVLERAGLIARSREAQWRPCRLKAEQLQGIDHWLNQYRQFWEQSFDRLDNYLQELQAEEKKIDRQSQK